MATAAAKVLVPWEMADQGYTIPNGKYKLKIVDAQYGETQAGDQKINIDYVVLAPAKAKGSRFRIGYTYNPAGIRELREMVTGVLGTASPRKASALNLDKLKGKVFVAEAYTTEGKNGGKFQHLKNVKGAATQQEEEPEPEPAEDGEDEGLEDVSEDELGDDDDLELG